MTLRVVRFGGLATIQDDGRLGRGHQGVARAGAWDQRARGLGNRLVGNDPHAAVIEIVLGDCELEAVEATTVALTGARGPAWIDGSPVGQDLALLVPAGARLRIGRATSGLRLTVALRGGVDVEPVLGSRSYDTLGRIGPPPLQAGDVIRSGPVDGLGPAWFEQVPTLPLPDIVEAAVIFGPRDDWLSDGARHELVSRVWTVSTACDRTGVRLDGAALARRPDELASEAMIPGAIQLPPDGRPIILGPDCGTTGGYPVVAVVTRADLDLVGQLRPGAAIRLRAMGSKTITG